MRTFDYVTADSDRLGLQAIDTVAVGHSKLSYKFSAGTAAAANARTALILPFKRIRRFRRSRARPWEASIKVSRWCAGASNGTNQIDTSFGTITLDYPDLLTGLSEAFRPDLDHVRH